MAALGCMLMLCCVSHMPRRNQLQALTCTTEHSAGWRKATNNKFALDSCNVGWVGDRGIAAFVECMAGLGY